LFAGRFAMSSLRPIPLGHPIPNRPHAISVSLPTMADLIGYETKDPAVIRQVPTGYPRFVLHPFVRTLTAEFSRRQGLQGRAVWLVSTPLLAGRLREWMGGDASVVTEGALTAVAFAADPERNARAKAFLQHCGGFISSRQAEDLLAAAGLVPAPERGAVVEHDPLGVVKRELRCAFTGARDGDLFVAANGMNAVHSAFTAVNTVQAPRGRTTWIQLGWLYLDTIANLRKFTADPAVDYVVVPSVHDLDALRRVLEERRGRVAGIITEAPTNPLVQCCDVPALAELVREHGAHLVLDASIASPWNIDVLPYADVALASLTKYAAAEGDLLAGAVAVNPQSSDADVLRAGLAEQVAPLYRSDLERLACEIGDTAGVLDGINASTMRVAEFLASRPEVKRVHWALAPASRENFLRVARGPGAVGCMISFELEAGRVAHVYDRARFPKGASFGLRNSLFCPFMYLAHYDLVTSPEGRALLARHGINPELLRLSVGLEPVDEIIGALAETFDAAKTV
jgi:cystathionine gamma-synthase